MPGMVSDVEVALTPEEMEGLDEDGIKALYEEKVCGILLLLVAPGKIQQHPVSYKL